MHIDSRIHAAISKEIPFDLELFRRTADAARETGIGALALTDHSDCPNLRRVWQAMDHEYPYVGPHYMADGVRRLPGLEVKVTGGPHLLVIGDRKTVRAYQERLNHLINGSGACPAVLFFSLQRDLELLSIFAHPFRHRGDVCRIDAPVYARFDAIGLNGRDLSFPGVEIRARTEIVARIYGLPVVAGSDAHHYHQIGTVYKGLPEAFTSIPHLKSMIADRRVRIRIDRALHSKVEAAREAKHQLKQRVRPCAESG